jgi:hypothetical protein
MIVDLNVVIDHIALVLEENFRSSIAMASTTVLGLDRLSHP